MTARRASALAVGGVVVIALLVVVLATWASSIGPSNVLRGDGPGRITTPTMAETSVSPSAQSTPSAESADDVHETPPWFRALAFLVDLAVFVVAVILAARLVRWLARARRRTRVRRRREAAIDEAFDVVEPPAAVAREMLADAPAQRAMLLEGSPRNAVVACWHRFETQAAEAGLERRAWETSSEYTMRVLDLVDAYQPAVSRLGELYREARFSEHELTEAHRQRALDALDEIHRTIGVTT
jgi:hypothetical protein